MADETSITRTRLLGLDVLRGVAILLVLGRHWPFVTTTEYPWLTEILVAWTRGGWIGVDVFFVLSGFLVSGLLFTEYKHAGTLALTRFYLRRGFKIYPSFYLLVLCGIMMRGWPTVRTGRENLLFELFFAQNYGRGIWVHTWSLAVEEHFYLLLPLLLQSCLGQQGINGKGRRTLLTVLLIICIVTPWVRYWTVTACPVFNEYSHMFPTHLRMDSLFWGVLLSYGYHFYRDSFLFICEKYRYLLLMVAIMALLPPFLFELQETPFLWTWGFSLLSIGSSALVMALLSCKGKPGVVAKSFVYLGLHSYSIYLWHVPIGLAVRVSVAGLCASQHINEAFLIYFLTSIAAGVVAARCIETPFLSLRESSPLCATACVAREVPEDANSRIRRSE